MLKGREGSNQFVRDWTRAALGTPDHDPGTIAKFDGALRRDLALNRRLDAAAALAEAAMPTFSKMEGVKIGQSAHTMAERVPETPSSLQLNEVSYVRRLMSAMARILFAKTR
jgi:hypothetical protein